MSCGPRKSAEYATGSRASVYSQEPPSSKTLVSICAHLVSCQKEVSAETKDFSQVSALRVLHHASNEFSFKRKSITLLKPF